MLTIANFHSSIKKNLRVVMSWRYKDIPYLDDELVRDSDKGL